VLPTSTRLFVSDVKKALEDQNAKELPNPLPKGSFLVLKSVGDCQVAIYQHDDAIGCGRTASSRRHSALPTPVPRHKDIVAMTREPAVRVGYKYIWGYDQNYTVENGRVSLTPCLPPQWDDKRDENQRTADLV
jgi:hypothetical protein